MLLVFFLIIRRPPRSTRPYTLFPNTTPFRSYRPPKTSLGVFARQPGYAGDLDALVLQRLGIGVRCLAIDASRIGLAVVDLARLFSEVLADVVAVLLHVPAQLAQQAAQLAGLRGLGHSNRTGLRGRRNLARWLYGAAAPGRGPVGRHRRLDNLAAAPDRTQHLSRGAPPGKAGP